MAQFHDSALIGASGQAGYQIERSLRFNSPDSANLSRTPATATNRRSWSWSGWVKRGKLGGTFTLFAAKLTKDDTTFFGFDSLDRLGFLDRPGNSTNAQLITAQVFRDSSAWYHIMVVVDTPNATAGDRLRFYINGVRTTQHNVATYPSQNYEVAYINNTVDHRIGVHQDSVLYYYDGYLTEVHFIDGQALTPSSFGETDTITGVWKPKRYSGTYGTNGFYLKFADNSGTTSTTLGKDSSGNGNNWTPNNFSVTAGSGNDSLIDTPTPYADGGNGRGNYATLNPLSTAATLSDGNLNANTSASLYAVPATIAFPATGKYYAEFTVVSGSSPYPQVGILDMSAAFRSNVPMYSAGQGVVYSANGAVNVDGAAGTTYSTFTTNDILSVAYDTATRNVWVAKNGTWQNSGNPAAGTGAVATASAPTQGYVFACAAYSLGLLHANFGQRPFAYTPPSGFLALNTQNLPEPSIKKPSSYMDVVTWTGNATYPRAITGLNFSPDLLWIKSRSNAYDNVLMDAVRGTGNTKWLSSNLTDAEGTNSNNANVTSLDSAGFTIGTTGGTNILNASGVTNVAWCWDAGSGTSTNNAGTITSTVSANASAGFSIITFTGNATAGATVGHGLGVAPKMVIYKARNNGNDWWTYHSGLTSAAYAIKVNGTDAQNNTVNFFNSTAPSATVLTLGYWNNPTGFNLSTQNYVAYCFSEVAGFSKFGSYSGTGSADGPFVFCGFRPRWVMVKRTDTGGYDWEIYDSARADSNVIGNRLWANLSTAENSATRIDFLSNGFKIRDSGGQVNGGTIVFAAFAESPAKYSLAR